jgi:hypothetical protein
MNLENIKILDSLTSSEKQNLSVIVQEKNMTA